ncbi:hypothetical protein [Nonlabens ponticola]|nr:hypothetical protein [Nonlabens ponticola]
MQQHGTYSLFTNRGEMMLINFAFAKANTPQSLLHYKLGHKEENGWRN